MWPSYVINLAANAERLGNCARQFDAQGIAWERIEGVNGWKLDDDEIGRVYSRELNAKRGKHPLVKPEIGCYLSHLESWRRIAEGPHEGGFVFEDDFKADSHLATALERLSAPSPDWDVVKLFSFDPTPKMVSSQPLGEGMTVGEPFRVPTCLIGYGLTKAAAQRLVEKSVPFFRPVDEDMKFFWEKDIKVALVMPPPIVVGDQSAATGTIGDERRATARVRAVKPLRQMFHKVAYQLDYLVRLYAQRLRGGK